MILETERTILRPFREEDAEDVYAYASDPRVGTAAGWKPHESVAESREIIRTVFASPTEFAVVDRASGRVIGSAGFIARPEVGRHTSNEIGYSLHPAYWGRGIMPEVVRRLLRFGFEDLGFSEIWCAHAVANRQSRRVIEKCGFLFAFEETITDGHVKDRPTRFCVLTREDWERGAGRDG